MSVTGDSGFPHPRHNSSPRRIDSRDEVKSKSAEKGTRRHRKAKGVSSKQQHSSPGILDYTQNFLLTGKRGANYIQAAPESCDRFEGYPKLNRLDKLKRELIERHAHIPLGVPFLWYPTRAYSGVREILGHDVKFDVILVNVPRGADITAMYNLRLDDICSIPSFIFLVIPESTAENLNRGRTLMANWGFRRAEEIVWVKTNTRGQAPPVDEDRLFVNVKEHILMGIRGTVRRSCDSHLIHCNVDTDVIVADELNSSGRREKPEELYHVIENFCQGLRRVEFFCGKQRRGWVTVDASIRCANYDPFFYRMLWRGGHLLPQLPEIDALRPKTPPRV